MTKETILATKNWSIEYPNYMAENEILDAMDEYAKAFANWIRTEKWNNRNGYDWCRYETIYSDISVKTTEELYSQFIEQQTENK